MAEVAELSKVVRTLPALVSALGQNQIFLHYDDEADILYINFNDTPVEADDSELTDDDLIIRYLSGKIVGITMLNARGKSN
ncbi:Protein of unknown function [Desulfotomaculum arcticum]|uniref:DUF2283 domain-containing protein n=1 Tax=Desulfotruncus arcticus DSM 17038 TaxID=1121424 RepID=A0A1I2MQU2_9FIRM|nr:DUF2283 domain-containing protein [Desulfotruncus arcticus]SFF93260.1 Protein of unknown function [Desulfotomaculum arcticum] [Desulfotruncus arcticus DSM 17038]